MLTFQLATPFDLLQTNPTLILLQLLQFLKPLSDRSAFIILIRWFSWDSFGLIWWSSHIRERKRIALLLILFELISKNSILLFFLENVIQIRCKSVIETSLIIFLHVSNIKPKGGPSDIKSTYDKFHWKESSKISILDYHFICICPILTGFHTCPLLEPSRNLWWNHVYCLYLLKLLSRVLYLSCEDPRNHYQEHGYMTHNLGIDSFKNEEHEKILLSHWH